MLSHYTTINTLALILKTRKIRFNRLDRVDDVSEGSAFKDYDLSKYIFVSCWTKEDLESIPQWHMYTDAMQGARISFGDKLFNYQPLDPSHPLIQQDGELLSPIPFDSIFNDNYIIPPMFLNRANFERNVLYVPNPEEFYKDVVDKKEKGNGLGELSIKMENLGFYKRDEWKFQKEFRFVLFILPGVPIPNGNLLDPKYIKDLSNYMIYSIQNQIPPSINYFDVEIASDALEDLVVTLGPLCDDSHRVIVESLLSQFAPKAKLKESALKGTIRNPLR